MDLRENKTNKYNNTENPLAGFLKSTAIDKE